MGPKQAKRFSGRVKLPHVVAFCAAVVVLIGVAAITAVIWQKEEKAAVVTTGCEFHADTPSSRLIDDALDLQPQERLHVPSAGNDTAAFAKQTFDSLCAMYTEIALRSKLPIKWRMKLVVFSGSYTTTECHPGQHYRLTQDSQPKYCEGPAGPRGERALQVMALPLASIEAVDSSDDSEIFASSLIAYPISTATAAAIGRDLLDYPLIISCYTGIWQGTLVHQGARPASSNHTYTTANESAHAEAMEWGIHTRSMGQCMKKFVAESEGAPTQGATPPSYIPYIYLAGM